MPTLFMLTTMALLLLLPLVSVFWVFKPAFAMKQNPSDVALAQKAICSFNRGICLSTLGMALSVMGMGWLLWMWTPAHIIWLAVYAMLLLGFWSMSSFAKQQVVALNTSIQTPTTK